MRMTNLPAVFPANTITVGKAQLTVFYQPKPFAASHDAVVLFPKFKCNKYIGLFMCAVIKMKHIDFTMVDRYNWKQLKNCKLSFLLF